MPSIIHNFEYDIFISYRHKDNKGGHWVTEFVDALKTELEATFKEDISIYFDENPHDGLLETHNVDKSLEGKLKCLIFIPIISQTYCDPKSFAWQHELCAFNKMAKEDKFGRDIKLRNGNVTSRILPVKIHDLNPVDKALFENELGGVIRAIEFIFKSAGVNRPLRANEDHPHDNLNKTFYRDQINKLANAIKEIIECLIHPEKDPSSEDSSFMPQHRQLSAILFTDIEGYTSLMQQSEQKAMVMKDRHRQIIQQEHKEFNGRIIRYAGDGTLSTFQSIVEAVKCALSMQQQFLKVPHVPVRMGLHFGDIIFNDEDIFGDGVNLASRIESLGVAGSVLISDKANEELHNHPSLKTVSVGVYQFKNVKRAVEVFALNHEGLVKPEPNSLTGKTEEKYSGPTTRKRWPLIVTGMIFIALISYFIFQSNFQSANAPIEAPGKSIAVLPFENLSGDKEQEYFSDGIAEEILNALAQIKDLKVAGGRSSSRFKGTAVDLQEVGEKLKVSTVLEGSVRRQGDRVRISVRLLNVEDGYQLWSEQFEGTLNDMFKIQEEIAVTISQRLKVTLLQSESLKIGKGLTQNTEAYDAVLKGRFFWEKRLLNESEKYFKEAIELDPNFAEAYVGLAETYALSPFFRFGAPLETMPKAQEAAEKAIRLDSSLTGPYFVIAFKKANFDWNRDEARAYFKKAFQENSKYAQGYYWYAHYLYNFEADFDGAVAEMQKAVETEPLSNYANLNLGFGLTYARKFKEALAVFRFAFQLSNFNPLAYVMAGYCNIGLEKWDEAQKDFETAASQNNDEAKAMLVHFYMKNGNELQAQKLYDELTSSTRTEYSSQYVLSTAASFLGKKDLAHEHFKKAFEQRDNWLPYKINLPIRLPNDALSDPRNMALMKKHFPFMTERR